MQYQSNLSAKCASDSDPLLSGVCGAEMQAALDGLSNEQSVKDNEAAQPRRQAPWAVYATRPSNYSRWIKSGERLTF